jgi:hypothetical protein
MGMRVFLIIMVCVILGCEVKRDPDVESQDSALQQQPPSSQNELTKAPGDARDPLETAQPLPVTDDEAKPKSDSILNCGDFSISNGKYAFNFTTDNLTQSMVVDLAIQGDGFVLSGGNLDELAWIVNGVVASFRIESDANALEGEGRFTRDNFVEGKMKQGRADGSYVHGTFTLEHIQADKLPLPSDTRSQQAEPAGPDGDVRRGQSALQRGDFETAYKIFKPLADSGDVNSMMTLGLMHHRGDGVEQNYATAMKWYVKAFTKMDGDAYNNIGVLYRDGLGVKQNKPIAYALFLITHMRGLGNEATQTRTNSNLRRLVERMTRDELRKTFNLTEEYVKEFVISAGTLEGIPDEVAPSPRRPRLRDKDWWQESERQQINQLYKDEPSDEPDAE